MEDPYFEYKKIDFEQIKPKDILLMIFHLREGDTKELVRIIKREDDVDGESTWRYRMISSSYNQEDGKEFSLYEGTRPNDIYKLTKDQARMLLL